MPPLVSVIIPARNESAHIEACLASVLAQELDGELEVVVADGSTDDTAELARAAGALVVDNPQRTTPAALNRALAAASGELIVRFDAHAEMPPGYVHACVRAMREQPEASNVGGWRLVQAAQPWQRATGAALASRFGVGNPRIWRRPAASDVREIVDTVPLGCWRADELRRAGGWDESFIRNQDFELNHRLRQTGGTVVFDPAIWSIYVPRESVSALARQYWQYGLFKAAMIRRAPESLRPRQLAPVALVATVVAAAVPSPLAPVARAGVGAYAALLVGVAARSGGGWRTAPVLAVMHWTWVAGLLAGLVRPRV